MNDQNLMLFPQKSRINTSTRAINTHVIKLWDDISYPNEYQEEIELIDSASEDDVIVLDICTGGGVLDTAMLFSRSLKSTAAHTVAIIGPTCASAGSAIALSCREFILDSTSSLMLHTSSYGISAKDTDIFEHANFSRKQLKSFYEEVYSGFISEEEMSDVIKGTPFYFSPEELVERLDSLSAYRKMLEEEGCDDENCQECSPQETIDTIIDKAVESGVTKALTSLLDKYTLTEKPKPEKKAAKPRAKKAVEAEVIQEVVDTP